MSGILSRSFRIASTKQIWAPSSRALANLTFASKQPSINNKENNVLLSSNNSLYNRSTRFMSGLVPISPVATPASCDILNLGKPDADDLCYLETRSFEKRHPFVFNLMFMLFVAGIESTVILFMIFSFFFE